MTLGMDISHAHIMTHFFQVIQFQFTDWPDKGVPVETDTFISFVRLVMSTQWELSASSDSKIPIVTHCSAGIGRTGTFIAVYCVLEVLLRRILIKEINVMEIVRCMRRQRRYMVQTRDQYKFIYHSLHTAFPHLLQDSFSVAPSPLRPSTSAPPETLRGRRRLSFLNRSIAASAMKASLNPEIQGAKEYAALLEIVVDPSLYLLQSLVFIINRADMDSLTNILFKIFGSKGALIPFALRVAKWEVENCDSPKLLFRGNSFVTKVIGACFNIYGNKYVVQMMRPLIHQMLEFPTQSYEIDAKLLPKGDNLGENRSTLRRAADHFFSAILASVSYFPLALRLLCHGILKATSEKFPEAALNAVGGALFLRFYAPLVISPETYGILEADDHELSPEIKRGLLLISKMIQHVANLNPTNGFREEHMQAMNGFVMAAVPRATEFLLQVSTAPSLLDPDTLTKCTYYQFPLSCRPSTASDLSICGPNRDGVVSDGVDAVDLIKLHQLLCQHSSELKRIFANLGQTQLASDLLSLLQTIGPAGNPTILPPALWRADGFQVQEEAEKIARRRSSKSRKGREKFSEFLTDVSLFDAASKFALEPIKEIAAASVSQYPDSNIRPPIVKFPNWDDLYRGLLLRNEFQ